MTFNEANVNRDQGGKFDQKVGSAPDIALDSIVVSLDDIEDMDWGDAIVTNADGIDPDALDITVRRVDDGMYEVAGRYEVENGDQTYFDFLEHEYQGQREQIPQSSLHTDDTIILSSAIPGEDELTRADLRLALADGEPGRYARDKATGDLEEKYRKYLIAYTESPAEKAIAKRSDISWKGTDSTTPDGTYLVTAREEHDGNGILYGYLMDEKERTIIGRTETQYSSHTNIGRSELYAGTGVKGGHWMRAEDSEEGTLAWNRRIKERHDADVRETINTWTSRTPENDSTLEHVLKREEGINVVLRSKLRKAYESENGRVEVPKLLRENEHLVNDNLYIPLLRLAEDPSQ